MTATQLGRPVGASGEQTRQRIIEATMRCVAQVGYSRTTIRQIARAADVTSASLYNYFPNKAELIEAAIVARADIALPRLKEAARSKGTIADRIEAILDASAELIREHPDLAAFEWAIRAESGLAVYPDDDEETGQLRALKQIVEEVVQDGRQAPDTDTRAAGEVVYALIYGLTELAAVAHPDVYQEALAAAKRLVRGTLFERGRKPARQRSPLI